MFGALGLAWAFPRYIPFVIVIGSAGAYGLARLYVSYR
jgi:hypothetical protein